MSDSQSKPAESSPPKRSSFERMLVWGAIVLLIGIVGLEARARFGRRAGVGVLPRQGLGTSRDAQRELDGAAQRV